jgi:hypothetical protein
MTTLNRGLRKALFEAGAFAGALAQEIKLGAAHFGVALHDNFFNARRTHQEGALNANAVAGNTSYGKIAIIAAAAQADDDSLEFLDTFIGAFFNPKVYLYHVARVQLGDIGVHRSLNGFNQVGHFSGPYWVKILAGATYCRVQPYIQHKTANGGAV